MSRLQEIKEKLQKAWENKAQIAEGFYNTYISNDQEIKAEIQRRLEICKACPYYDAEGKAEKIVLKGKPGCSACGCTLPMKAACMSCNCGIEALKRADGSLPEPLKWEGIMTAEQETELQRIQYQKQFEHRKNKQ